MKIRRSESAFTLIELLAVITIIAIIAAIVGPSLNHFRKGDAMLAATRQMLDDVAAARQLAISQRTTVYMVFVGTNFWTSVPTPWNERVTNLCDKQLTGYSFVCTRSAGDQPGQGLPRYLTQWRRLPESIYITPEKFSPPNTAPMTIIDSISGERWDAAPFKRYSVPFPHERQSSVPGGWPCIAFNYLGQLVSGQDEYIPLVHGNILYARDLDNKRLQTLPALVNDQPPNNVRDSYNIIHIDWLTGRARLERRRSQ